MATKFTLFDALFRVWPIDDRAKLRKNVGFDVANKNLTISYLFNGSMKSLELN